MEIALLEENNRLKQLVKKLLDDVCGYDDGCGCCATQSVAHHPCYKEIKAILKQDVELPTTNEVVEKLTT